MTTKMFTPVVEGMTPVVEGIKGSFKLSAGLLLAVGTVISSFAHHTLSLKDDCLPSQDQGDNQHTNGHKIA